MPKRFWYLLHEPRVVTAVTGGYWVIVIAIGLAALLSPPSTIAFAIGPTLTLIWGWFLLIGGILGLAGALPGWWWIERAGILAAATGTLIYLATVIILHYTADGSRLVQSGFIALCLFALVVRWLRIRGPQVDPARGPQEAEVR